MTSILLSSGQKFIMDKIIFRQPRPGDFQAIYNFAKAIQAEDTFILLNPEEPVTLKEEREYFADLLKKIRQKKWAYQIVLDGKKMIGSCGIEKQGRRQGHIGVFGVSLLKPYRSQGIGRQLAEKTMALAKKKLGITQIALECFANNKIGINFYPKLGFTQYGIHPQAVRYQGKLIDKILFYKNLE